MSKRTLWSWLSLWVRRMLRGPAYHRAGEAIELAPTPRTFWVGISNEVVAEALDDAVMRRLLARAGDVVVVDVEQMGCADLVNRIHALSPATKVVMYFFCQKPSQKTKVSGEDWATINAARQRIALIKKNGDAKVIGTTVFGDMTCKAWRDMRLAQVVAQVTKYGVDGVLGDNTHGDLNPYTPYAGTLELEGKCATLTTRIYSSDGSAGTVTLVGDGVGPGSMTGVWPAVTFHFAPGTTTHTSFEGAITNTGILGIAYPSPTPAAKLATGDALVAGVVDGQVVKGQSILAGCYTFYDDLRAALPGKLVAFNGLWNNKQTLAGQYPLYPYQVQLQASILARPALDMATCEFYGMNAIDTAYDPADPFDEFVTKINTEIVLQPTKRIFIHGTTPDLFYTYSENLRNARYCHACYLVGARNAGDLTSFFFSQDFQAFRLGRSRAGGLAQHSYQDLPLGDPVGASVANGTGGYSREYQGLMVYLAPENHGLQLWTTSRTMWTTTGVLVPSGTTFGLTNDAMHLLFSEPAGPDGVSASVIDFPSEWLLEMVTTEYRYTTCTVQYRTTDTSAQLQIRAEVDNNPRPYAIAHVLAAGGAYAPGTTDQPYRQTTTQLATHSQAPQTLTPDGVLNTLVIDLPSAFGALTPYRVPSIRAVGSIEVMSIDLRTPVLVDTPFDPNKPIASFTESVNFLQVTFTNTSLDNDGTIVSHAWDFGDGATSTLASPVHTYATVGAKVVSLTETDNDGKVSVFSKTVTPTITTDGPNSVYMPASVADWTAVGITAPQHSWRFGMAAGDATDSIGAMTLTANAIAEYLKAVVGWTRTGARFDSTVSQRFRTTTGPDSAVTPTLLTMVVYLQKPAATALVASLGTNVDLRHRATGKLFVNCNGSSTDGTAVYDGDVYLVCLHNDPTNNAGGAGTNGLLEYETNINTPTPVKVTTGYTDPTGTLLAVGPTSAVAAFTGVILDAWLWDSGTFPTANAIATALGWVEAE